MRITDRHKIQVTPLTGNAMESYEMSHFLASIPDFVPGYFPSP